MVVQRRRHDQILLLVVCPLLERPLSFFNVLGAAKDEENGLPREEQCLWKILAADLHVD